MSSSESAKHTRQVIRSLSSTHSNRPKTDDDGGHASTGWETLLEGMIKAGWAVTATWPIRTERVAVLWDNESNALASSIVLACRPRPADAGFTDRRGLINALREEFPDALRKLEQGKVAPVDLRQAAIGPGMAVFSRYARVNEPDGSPMRVRAALSLINQVLDEKLSQLEGRRLRRYPVLRGVVQAVSGSTRGRTGPPRRLSKGIDTSINGLERGGVLISRAGKVKLRSVREIPDLYDPGTDDRTSEWEICLHLAKRLAGSGGGRGGAADGGGSGSAGDRPGRCEGARLPAVLHRGEEGVGGDRAAVQQPRDVVDGPGGRVAEGGTPGRQRGRVSSRWSSGAMTMATSNRDRIDQGLQLLQAGLQPFVDAVMSAPAPGGRDWVEMLDARNNARRGTHFSTRGDDPRFLLKVITDEWRVFSDKLSRAEQSFASELRETGNRLAHDDRRSAPMTRTGRWTRWSGC